MLLNNVVLAQEANSRQRIQSRERRGWNQCPGGVIERMVIIRFERTSCVVVVVFFLIV